MSLSGAILTKPDAAASLSSVQLRSAFAQFPQGVVLVGAEIDGAPEGIIVSTFTVGVSLDPPLVSVAMQHTSRTWPRLRDYAPLLGISVVGADQRGLARQMGSKDRAHRFTDVKYTSDDDGALILDRTPLWLKTRIHHQFTAGDHDVVILEVLDLGADQTQAGLVFHQSAFKPLAAVEA